MTQAVTVIKPAKPLCQSHGPTLRAAEEKRKHFWYVDTLQGLTPDLNDSRSGSITQDRENAN